MKARLIHPGELDAGLIARWNVLRASNPVYRSPFYAASFTRAVGLARDDARVAVIEDAGEVVGFLPFHRTRSDVGKPIGGHINDYHGPILQAGRAFSSKLLLQAAKIAAYDFNHLPVSIGVTGEGAWAFSNSPQMDLGDGYEAYNGRKASPSWTKAQAQMRRRWRKTEAELGPIRFTTHDPCDNAFAQHWAMRRALHARLRVRPDFSYGWIRTVLEWIRAADEPDLAGVFSTMHAGDRLVAAHFGMRSAGVWHWWYPSYDLEAHNLSPGINLIDQCARAAQGEGIATFDFGRGDNHYKELFANQAVTLCEGSMTRAGSLAAGVRHASQALVSLAGKLPLGRMESYPQRAVARLISGVALPSRP